MGGPPGTLATHPFGPFTKGVVDSANSSLPLQGALRSARNAVLSGINALSIRPGTQVALTLMDDQGTPAPCTKVCYVGPFADGALAVGYSSATHKTYVYRVDAGLTGYYDTAGTFHAGSTAVPNAVLWSSMTAAPDVLVTEGLGTAYLAHTVASDANGLYWPTKTYTDFATVASLAASGTDGSAGGTDTAYFNGVIAFQQALWGWGYGAGSTASTGFRPEMARFSPPSFGNLQLADSETVGDRVRSQRERIVGAGVAGIALYLGATNLLARVTGAGRASWYKEPVDRSYGFVGPKCMVTAGETLYYWSRRGPMRIEGIGSPEPLWDAIPAAIATVVNASQLVAGFDPDRDQVLFAYDTGTGLRTACAFDVRREVWLGPDNDLGVTVACLGTVEPYVSSTAAPPSGPAGAPTSASTDGIGQTAASLHWVTGDVAAQTEVSYRIQGTTPYTVVGSLVAAGVTSYTLTGLTASTAYEWRVRHALNGQYSSYLGPVAGSQFTTLAVNTTTLQPPTNLSGDGLNPELAAQLYWTNSGESGVTTEVWRSADNTTFNLVQNVATGLSSARVPVTSYGTWYFEVRHAKSDGSTSPFTSSLTVQVGDAV